MHSGIQLPHVVFPQYLALVLKCHYKLGVFAYFCWLPSSLGLILGGCCAYGACFILDGCLHGWSIAIPRFSGWEGYVHCGLLLIWASFYMTNALLQWASCTGMRFGARLQWE